MYWIEITVCTRCTNWVCCACVATQNRHNAKHIHLHFLQLWITNARSTTQAHFVSSLKHSVSCNNKNINVLKHLKSDFIWSHKSISWNKTWKKVAVSWLYTCAVTIERMWRPEIISYLNVLFLLCSDLRCICPFQHKCLYLCFTVKQHVCKPLLL